MTLAQARAAMDGVSTELVTRFAGLDRRRRIEVLPALGLYAVVAFTVGERTKEIGIRSALGARRSRVDPAVVLRYQ